MAAGPEDGKRCFGECSERNAVVTGLFSSREELEMNETREEGEGPLSSEELERDEWRRGETRLSQKDAPGHTLPESERDGTVQEGGDGERPGLVSSTILPPD
jgi:hypothetical protein